MVDDKTPPAALLELARRHAQAEAEDDMAATLATLEPQPAYEFFPAGRGFSGLPATRRYYRHFFEFVRPRIAGYTLHGEWLGPDGLAQEYSLQVRGDDGRVGEHRMIGILLFGRTALAGERMYGSEELFRLLVGPMWDELAPIA
jgi:hypothetical protein